MVHCRKLLPVWKLNTFEDTYMYICLIRSCTRDSRKMDNPPFGLGPIAIICTGKSIHEHINCSQG